MPETEMLIGQGGALPIVSSVKVGNGPYIVLIDWAEGSRAGKTDAIDLAPVILTYKVFKPLRDDARLFATVRVSEYGNAIEWGPDDSLAVSGETLERLAEEVMTPAQFSEFMKRNKLSLDATAAQLGISRRMVAYYAKDRQIPRTVALACKQVEVELNASGTKALWKTKYKAGSFQTDGLTCTRVPVGAYHLDVFFPSNPAQFAKASEQASDLAQELARKFADCTTFKESDEAQEEFIRAVNRCLHVTEPDQQDDLPFPPGMIVLARSKQL